MQHPLFQIYLIVCSAIFAFLAVSTRLFRSYSISDSFFMFFFNLAMAYLAVLFWKAFENKVINKKNNGDKLTDLVIFTLFTSTSIAIFFLVYFGFFRLLFGQSSFLPDIAIYSAGFFVFVSLFIMFSLVQTKTSLIRQKNSSLDYILQSQKIMEVEILKYQIDPHFIFNAFNTLFGLTSFNSSPV